MIINNCDAKLLEGLIVTTWIWYTIIGVIALRILMGSISVYFEIRYKKAQTQLEKTRLTSELIKQKGL